MGLVFAMQAFEAKGLAIEGAIQGDQ